MTRAVRGRNSEARKGAEAIHAEIGRQIDQGLLRPGERLATERDLAIQFGVSRASARAAVMELVRVGKISRHVGRGSFVREPSVPGEKPAPHSDLSPAEIMEFRVLLEPNLVDLILLNANNSEIQAIAACVEEAESATERVQWNRFDDKFHLLLARATHNRIVIALYESFSAARQGAAWVRLKQKTVNEKTWRTFQSEHRIIADALLRGDRNAAITAMRHHIMRARALMMGFEVPAADLRQQL